MANDFLSDWNNVTLRTRHDLAKSVDLSLQTYLKDTAQSPRYNNGDRDVELERLDLQHQLFHMTLGRKLYLSPLSKGAPSVLDIATGDATWVLAFAAQNSSATIVANNSSPMETTRLPPNITPDISDANGTWPYSQKFDFIHCRQHHRRLEERNLFAQAFESLNPGGWLEMQELCNPVSCDDGTLTEGSPLAKWGRLLVEASQRINRPTDNPTKYEAWMRAAGFVNCRTVVHKWPTNPWPEDEEGKIKGLWNLYNVLHRFEEFSTALLVKVLGWKLEDAKAFLLDVRAELQNPDVHAYWPVYFVYAQKPQSASESITALG